MEWHVTETRYYVVDASTEEEAQEMCLTSENCLTEWDFESVMDMEEDD